MDNKLKFETLKTQADTLLGIVKLISSVMEADEMTWAIANYDDSDLNVDISFGKIWTPSEHCQAICKPLCKELAKRVVENNERENVYIPVRAGDINNLQEFGDTGVNAGLTYFVLDSVRKSLKSRSNVAERELERYV